LANPLLENDMHDACRQESLLNAATHAGHDAGRAEEAATSQELLVSHALRQHITEARYKLWFENHTRFTVAESVLTIGVPNLYLHDWLKRTFEHDIRDSPSSQHCSKQPGGNSNKLLKHR
jgi:DnaA N-terminal domain